MFGNLVSAAAGFLLASKGRVDGVAFPATLIGISLVVASGCVLNNWIDRNLDQKMARTRNRPLAKGLVSPKIAVAYAAFLGLAGLALLRAAANLLAVSHRAGGSGDLCGDLQPLPEAPFRLRRLSRLLRGSHAARGGLLRRHRPR